MPTMIAAPKTMNCIAGRQAENQQHLRQDVSASAAIQVEVALASPPEKRRARNDDCGDRREQVGGAEGRVDVDADTGEQDRRDAVEDAGRRVRERRRAFAPAGRPSTRLSDSRPPPDTVARRTCSEARALPRS